VLGDIRLWITVGLVALFAVVWQLTFLVFNQPVAANTANFLPLGVFLVPVLYASVTFGLFGGVLVASVSAVATVPWAVQSLRQTNLVGAWYDVVQVVVLLVVAYFVGRTVRAERAAREAAERSRQDHLLAEIRYRDLFETNSQPIFLVDLAGVVSEANVAAEDLFGHGPGSLVGAALPQLIGEGAFAAVRSGDPYAGTVGVPDGSGGPGPMYRPAARMVTLDGQPMLQVVLQDVTEDARRRQRAQAYAADVVRGQEDERRRIAQELHDGPLQTLVHICRMIDGVAAGGLTALRPRERAVTDGIPTLAQLRAATESVVTEVRQISRGLRPTLLDDLGLMAALERLCDNVEHRAGVAASLRLEGTIPALTPAAELTVYRIAQEALSNVDQHAGASSVEVTLSVVGDRLQLRITDDGEGFDQRAGDAAAVEGSLGLPGMLERAELVGGTVQVRSRPGEGTTVVVSIPVERSGQEMPVGDQPTLR
jgi:signal transduction histidine kinase